MCRYSFIRGVSTFYSCRTVCGRRDLSKHVPFLYAFRLPIALYVKIAPFHPLFEFSGSGIESVDNLTNRSPYPTFHILREEEVSTAVRKIGGDSSKIWQRNVSLLQTFEEELGREKTEMIMRGEKVECMEDILSKIKE